MSKLVQKVKWDLSKPHAEITEMYMYGEADFESNNAMQEPLKKLYEYENQYDTVKEYIKELKLEIERLEKCIINDKESKATDRMLTRCETLQEVINDLRDRFRATYWIWSNGKSKLSGAVVSVNELERVMRLLIGLGVCAILGNKL